jgi:hypothetical protein
MRVVFIGASHWHLPLYLEPALAQPGVKLDRASVYKLNQSILGYHHADDVRKNILAGAGYADDNSVLGAAVELNALDDWSAFHAEVLK